MIDWLIKNEEVVSAFFGGFVVGCVVDDGLRVSKTKPKKEIE